LTSAVKILSRSLQDPNRIAGILLVSSFLVPLLALVILVISGAFPSFSAGLQGSLAEKAPFGDTFRLLNLLWTVGWILQVMGFGMLTRLLLDRGDVSLAIPAFIAMLIAAILGVLHGTFHMSVETWAAQETARTGSIPQVYEPLSAWVGVSFRIAYILHLLAVIIYGWAILRTELLAHWVGWLSIGWSMLWILGYLVGAGVPGILFIVPAVLGAALLWR